MNPSAGFVNQVPQNYQGQVPANSNPQTQLNSFLGNVPNTLNPPPFMPGPSFPNGSNMAAYNALMMQNGMMGIQNMQCLPPNFNTVAGMPFQGQFYNGAQNLNQLAGQQLHGQFSMQGLWPQTFAPNMNQIMSMLQGQMNSQNTVMPMNNVLPQQPTNPYGPAQAAAPNQMFSQYMRPPSCPNNLMVPSNAMQQQPINQQPSATAYTQNLRPQFAPPPQLGSTVQQQPINQQPSATAFAQRPQFAPPPQLGSTVQQQPIDQQRSATAFPQNSRPQFAPPLQLGSTVQQQPIDQQRSATAFPQNLRTQFAPPPQLRQNTTNGQNQMCQETLTKRYDNISNAKLGNGLQSFTPSPQGNWNKGNSQTRFLKSNSHHMTNGRGGVKNFNRNRGDAGPRNGTQRIRNTEAFDNKPLAPRRRLSLNYTEAEVRQWREARRRNYPTTSKIAKKMRQNFVNLAMDDEDAKARRKQLRDILARQAELGVEVAELPQNYLSDSENQNSNKDRDKLQRGTRNNGKGRFQNKFNKRGRTGHERCIKRPKPMNGESSAPAPKRSPTLLQKLLSADIKKDNSKLLQVFRFITLNSFFEHWPEKTLIYPQVTAKDAPYEGDTDGGASGANSGLHSLKVEESIESISGIKKLTEENVGDMDSDEDIGSSEGDDSAEDEDEDSELSDKSEEGEI